MKKAFSMALTVAMMFVLGVTVFAADLPTELPTETPDFLTSIVDFFANILRAFGELIGKIFQ